MPWGDRTGPGGMGPMTGRAMGYCAGYPVPGYLNPAGGGWGYGLGFGRGRGYGLGFGRGRGFGGSWGRGGGRGRFFAGSFPFYGGARYGAPWAAAPYPAPYAYTPAATAPYAASAPYPGEIELLKEQASYFENVLGDIKKQISELEAKPKEE